MRHLFSQNQNLGAEKTATRPPSIVMTTDSTKKNTTRLMAASLLAIALLLISTITLGVLLADEKNNDDTTASSLDLPPQAVTLWWVIFNNPENCIQAPDADIKCGPLDAFGAEFLSTQALGEPDLSTIVVNTDSGFAMLYATGDVSDAEGEIRLQASIYKSPQNLSLPLNMDPMVQGVAFTDPDKAEVHAIVRTHGDYIDFTQTLSDIDDYCVDPPFSYVGSKSGSTNNVCADFMTVAFAAGQEGSQALAFAETGESVSDGEARLFRTGDSLQILIETSVA